MRSSIFKAAFLLLNLTLVELQVCSSKKISLADNQMLRKIEDDNILTNFLNQFQTVYLDKYTPRHVTIMGSSTEDLEQAETLLRSYPSIVCKDLGTCVYHWRFGPGSFVFIFIKDPNEDTIENNAIILSRCRRCKVLFIYKGKIDSKLRVSLLFSLSEKQNGGISQLATVEKNEIKIYSNFVVNNCSVESRLMTTWTSGIELNIVDATWITSSMDLNGCPIYVSTLNFAPKMLIKEDENGLIKIKGGIEGELISTFAEKLNFTIIAKHPSSTEQIEYSRKSAILNDISTGKAEIGIGRLRPMNYVTSVIGYSFPYDHECITWGVPRLIDWADDIVWMEFPWRVWALVLLAFTAISIAGHLCHCIDAWKANSKSPEFSLIILEVMSIHLGNPVVNVPKTITGRLLLMLTLQYTLITNTAYKTSLASILATDIGSPEIHDAEGIIKANLTVGGSSYNLEFLQDQENGDETLSKLIERYVVVNNNTEAMHRLKSGKSFACLSRGSALTYERLRLAVSNKPINFHVFKECVLKHQTVMVFRKESVLLDAANKLIINLLETGMIGYWNNEKSNPDNVLKRKPSTEEYDEMSMINKFQNIFFVYASCVFLCLVTFFVEIGTSIYNSKTGK